MLFLRAEGIVDTVKSKEEENRREYAKKLASKGDVFNQKLRKKAFFFVSDCSDGNITVGIITYDKNYATESLNSYLKYIGVITVKTDFSEITFENFNRLLTHAERQSYIDDKYDILAKYGLDKISDCGFQYGENLIDDRGKKEVFSFAEKSLANETLLPELERIYSNSAPKKAKGHPVHYMIQTDDVNTRRRTYKLLLQALFANNRLESRRYSFLDINPHDEFSSFYFDELYKASEGGTVIVRYLANLDSEDGGYAMGEREMIEDICAVIKRYQNKVLTVLCFRRESKETKAIFYENLGSVSMVEINEDFAYDERAVSFLKMLAKESNIRTDKALFSKLEKGKGYLAPDLQIIFNEWYNKKLKSSVYPQYKDIAVARKEAFKEKVKGNAYNELLEMTGLKEAKEVISKALNYYKMQRLYEEKGFKHVYPPSMHMVFTGNPGTAKTTVARLFARIMKANGILSKGQLIEVGRSDLVAKYVGWTAKNVQAKFKAASGGVLFIDEAYSLVDEQNGSFGYEAINTIVQEMENRRGEVIVIFAGYSEEMENFLKTNPGLRSRIAFHVPFSDYTADELVEIAGSMSKSNGIKLEEDAVNKLKVIFDCARRQSDFGNGRYVRNILEQARMNQASRLLRSDFESITEEEISKIKAEDIILTEPPVAERHKIGFA